MDNARYPVLMELLKTAGLLVHADPIRMALEQAMLGAQSENRRAAYMSALGALDAAAETTGHGYAYCCEVCDGTDPHWHIMRRGDVVTSWACDDHLAVVCGRLQRDFEVTELIVTDSRKAGEQAAITQSAYHYHDSQLCKCPWT